MNADGAVGDRGGAGDAGCDVFGVLARGVVAVGVALPVREGLFPSGTDVVDEIDLNMSDRHNRALTRALASKLALREGVSGSAETMYSRTRSTQMRTAFSITLSVRLKQATRTIS